MMKHFTFFLVLTTAVSCSAQEKNVKTPFKGAVKSVQTTSISKLETSSIKTSIQKISLSEDEWKLRLSDTQFEVLRHGGTEPAFSGEYNDFKSDGIFLCAACGNPLFDTQTKFDSGTGWPSFTEPVGEKHILKTADRSYGMSRIEIKCARCEGHLGHVFSDGPPPTNQRYCINSMSLQFRARDSLDDDEDPDKK